MPQQTRLLISICLLFLTGASARAAEAIAADWAGGMKINGQWSPFLLHAPSKEHGPAGSVDLVAGLLFGQALDNFVVEAGHVHFETGSGADHLVFDGELRDGSIEGKVTSGNTQRIFRLYRTIKADVSRFAGNYELEPGHVISLTTNRRNLSGVRLLIALDSQTGQNQLLFARSATTFFSGPFSETPAAETTVEFEKSISKWKTSGSPLAIAKRIDFPEENVSFKNGSVTLAGTLILPIAPGPHPAVVFAHGSGPDSRANPFYRTMANCYAANGVAVLIYDKRGVGESTGNWKSSGFDDFAGDTLAGVDLLRTRPDIDHQKIGVSGMSQGGWIVALCAARSPDIAFIISLSGPGVSPEEQGAYMVEHRVRAEGFGDAEVREALAMYQMNSHCAKTNSGWTEYEAALELARKAKWYHPEYTPQNRDEHEQWRAICDFDPAAVLEKVHCPVLALLGKVDPLLPAEKSAEVWKESLARAGNTDVTISIFPYADHSLGDPNLGMHRPEFFTIQRDWLIRHVQRARQ